jgi:hypothetical protein
MSDTEEIARWCGYNTAWDMLVSHKTTEELLDLLKDLLAEDTDGWFLEEIQEIAHDVFDWNDPEQARADAEEAQYQAYRDMDADNDDMVGC